MPIVAKARLSLHKGLAALLTSWLVAAYNVQVESAMRLARKLVLRWYIFEQGMDRALCRPVVAGKVALLRVWHNQLHGCRRDLASGIVQIICAGDWSSYSLACEIFDVGMRHHFLANLQAA